MRVLVPSGQGEILLTQDNSLPAVRPEFIVRTQDTPADVQFGWRRGSAYLGDDLQWVHETHIENPDVQEQIASLDRKKSEVPCWLADATADAFFLPMRCHTDRQGEAFRRCLTRWPSLRIPLRYLELLPNDVICIRWGKEMFDYPRYIFLCGHASRDVLLPQSLILRNLITHVGPTLVDLDIHSLAVPTFFAQAHPTFFFRLGIPCLQTKDET